MANSIRLGVMNMRSLYLVLLTAAVVITVAGCREGDSANALPLPELPPAPIEMRVAHVVNPALPRMDSAQLAILLDATRKTAREHFGVDLRFAAAVEIPIDTLFQRIPAEQRRRVAAQIYDFKTGKGDPIRFEKSFAAGLKENGDAVAEVMQFARPHLDEAIPGTYEALGTALAKLQLRRIERWQQVKALDGGPAIDASPYNEFVLWDSLGDANLPFELVLTNQIIASVEYVNPAAHTAIRGGYSNGVTTLNKHSRYKTTAVWSTFAFTTKDEWVVRMRSGESYEANEAARLAGISAAHEIGHQLFHLGHPYGKTACLMNPVPLFGFRAWADGLSSSDCPLGSSPAMRPGAVKFFPQQP